MPESPTASDIIQHARQRWIERLTDLSRRNTLLFFRELKRGTLPLEDAKGSTVERLFAGQTVRLDQLFTDEETLAERAKNLRTITRRASTNREERGLETLFVTCGSATWHVADGGRPPDAPVLLLPVVIVAAGRDWARARLRIAGEVRLNPVLLYQFEATFNCHLDPTSLLTGNAGDTLEGADATDEVTIDLDDLTPKAVFDRLEHAAHKVPGFELDRARRVVGNFSFQKMAMVRDLRDAGALFVGHRLVAALAGDVTTSTPSPTASPDAPGAGADGIVALRALDEDHPSAAWLAFDADGSQRQAIQAILSGCSGVIHGPPGTGKSQTIANLLGALAAQGKRVLFVAEKRAALAVVMERLREAGLDHLALDLHGADVARKAIIAQFGASFERLHAARPPAREGREALKALGRQRDHLRDHARRMNASQAPLDQSVYDILGRLCRYEAAPPRTRFRERALARLNRDAIETAREALEDARPLADLVLGSADSPWTGARVPNGTVARKLYEHAEALARRHWPALGKQLAGFVRQTHFTPETLVSCEELVTLAARVAEVLKSYDEALFTEELDRLTTALAAVGTGERPAWFAWLLDGAYRRARACLLKHHRTGRFSVRSAFPRLVLAARLQRQWRRCSQGATRPGAIDGLAALRNALQAVVERLKPLEAALNPRAPFAEQRLNRLGHRLDALAADAATPQRLPQVTALIETLEGLGLKALLREFRDTRAPAESWPDRLEHAWRQSGWEQAREHDSKLAAFDATRHDERVAEFTRLDEAHRAHARHEIVYAHARHATAVRNQYPIEDQLVRREAAKKRRHLPLRRLVREAPHVLTALRPCWMASPLSVSQLLPTVADLFDVVLFDEASQVLPEDAIPALLRAPQAVAAGDRHQLPPTTFFMADEARADDDEETTGTEGLESLLDALESFLPTWPLRWHYRSRDEALIDFSNQHIYQRRLVTMPAATREPAVQHVLVSPPTDADREWDPAEAEAQRVVELILAHAAERPNESLGVIALGITHANRLQARLDAAREAHAELDDFFHDRAAHSFFIKNLERVQGDERDAIILSVGYGKPAGGTLPHRFGPLLYEGGERRLNVAVTRARQRITVVSTFTHDDISLERTHARGARLLREYLRYASEMSHATDVGASASEATGAVNLDAQTPMNTTTDAVALSPLECDIAAALAAEGLAVTPLLGASAFPIALALRHPDRAERYVLAVETDGPIYARLGTVRDRDRLRRQQLQRLGWQHHRVWALDWFANKTLALQRLRAAYAEALATGDPVNDDSTRHVLGLPGHANADSVRSGPGTDGSDSRSSRRPRIPQYASIDDYANRELDAIVRWIRSDGQLRTDDEVIDEIIPLLGFQRRGTRIVAAITASLRRARDAET